MEYLIAQLEAKGMADHTAIVIAADHFPYGLDDDGPLGSLPYTSELYGYDVSTYFQRDHNRLIVWSGALEAAEPIVVDTPTSSIDILPTLLNLFGCEWDSRLLPGRDVFSDAEAIAFNANYDWKTELGTYYASSGKFVPVSDDVVIPDDYVKNVKAIVKNKINYCDGVLETDYFRHIFG
jgi:lipoteichoic acid synthase